MGALLHNGSFKSDKSGPSYAVIKNLRRRGKISGATPASSDVAGDIEASNSLFANGANEGGQGFISANSNASTAGTDSLLDFEDAVYSAGALDDDFGLFLHDPLTAQTFPSPRISTSMTDADSSTSRFPSASPYLTLAPTSALRMQRGSNATTSSAEKHMPDGRNYDVVASPALEHFPQMESGATKNIGNEALHGLLWEAQDDSLANGWTHSAMEGLSKDTARVQTTPLSSDSPDAVGETRRVSLFLEDMQPETANRVTSMLLNSNVDLKMKMTVR